MLEGELVPGECLSGEEDEAEEAEDKDEEEHGQSMDVDVPTTPPHQAGTRRPQPGSAGEPNSF